MHLLETLNPVAGRRGMVSTRPINARPSTLDGKTVGLHWSGTHGGDVALNLVGDMLKERFKDLKTNFYNAGGYPAPTPMLRQMAAECDVAVMATAD